MPEADANASTGLAGEAEDIEGDIAFVLDVRIGFPSTTQRAQGVVERGEEIGGLGFSVFFIFLGEFTSEDAGNGGFCMGEGFGPKNSGGVADLKAVFAGGEEGVEGFAVFGRGVFGDGGIESLL